MDFRIDIKGDEAKDIEIYYKGELIGGLVSLQISAAVDNKTLFTATRIGPNGKEEVIDFMKEENAPLTIEDKVRISQETGEYTLSKQEVIQAMRKGYMDGFLVAEGEHQEELFEYSLYLKDGESLIKSHFESEDYVYYVLKGSDVNV